MPSLTETMLFTHHQVTRCREISEAALDYARQLQALALDPMLPPGYTFDDEALRQNVESLELLVVTFGGNPYAKS